MRKVIWIVLIACIAAQGVLAANAEAPQRVIPCSEIIAETGFPHPGGRTIFKSVTVPAALGRGYPTRETPWRYFAKQGMVVKRGTTVTIAVPSGWRQRVAISWGNSQHRVFHTIRIAACRLSGRPEPGYAYAGGFFLRKPTGCVPLTFAVGKRRKTMWFGIGKRCR